MKDKLNNLIKEATEHFLVTGQYFSLDNYTDFLIAKGVIVLPCKVGDTVYHVFFQKDWGKVFESKVTSIEYLEDNEICLHCLHYNGYTEPLPLAKYLGKDIFLTKEDAETSLAEKLKQNYESEIN